MADNELVVIPGVCAGHEEHPELLWMFHILPSGQLRFSHIEIDFPEHASTTELGFRKFDVDMAGFRGCPYCEATLYFFCKRCRALSCFAWEQVNEARQWTCWTCHSTYRMKPKKTPFRVEAQVGEQAIAGESVVSAHAEPTTSKSNPSPARTTKPSIQDTQMWHPKLKR